MRSDRISTKFASETLRLVDETFPYPPAGAVFATDRRAVREAAAALWGAAANLHVNEEPVGSVVGKQAFGGARGSGTSDKAGSKLNLVRWGERAGGRGDVPPPRDFRYTFMAEK